MNGMSYAGWTELGVTRAMDAVSGAFTVALTERWEGRGGMAAQVEPWPILPGDACEVRLGGVPLVVGYVDIFRPSYGPESHTINIQGRDKAADMIDCSAVHSPDEWKNIDLLKFAQIIAQPFGIPVRADVSVGEPFQVIKLNQGETAFEAIERYARQRKLLAMPDGAGGLLLTRAGTQRASVALVQGKNIKEASGSIDHSQRFSQYTVKAQTSWSEATDGEAEAHIEGAVTDSGVKRYRPMLVIAEADGTANAAKERATWEANTRIGKSATASITVQGWRQYPGGPLWLPNMLVNVRSSWLRMDGEMMIRQVTFTRDDGGTQAKLDIVSPQAFAPEPPDSLAAKKAGKKDDDGKLWKEALGEEKK
ncbi:phage baseplate assembly protein [Azorhizophilus paspali]|uniref:phage baseplate assembly protein n=1 Tax=Azorhizophilus paspali TaxID=69963 RepID=UPI0036705932